MNLLIGRKDRLCILLLESMVLNQDLLQRQKNILSMCEDHSIRLIKFPSPYSAASLSHLERFRTDLDLEEFRFRALPCIYILPLYLI